MAANMNTPIQAISSYFLHSAFTTLFFDAWLKSLAVLTVAGGLCCLLRRAAAATRHWVWFLAVASLPCLLLLAAVPHSWQRPLWSVSTGFNSGNEVSLTLSLVPGGEAGNPTAAAAPAGPRGAAASEGGPESSPPIAARFSGNWLVLAVTVWLVGTALGLVSMLAGQFQLSRLARNGRFLQDVDWKFLVSEACERLRLHRPVRLLQSVDNLMPITWGWWRPVVLLPAEAARWPAERRRVVLLHELAHAKRWDCLTQTIARIVCAFYWINPLVWLAARRMCVERERACDDLVLNSGCRASDYASHLVEIARSFRRMPQFAGIAMARSPQLRGRVAAIVDASRARRLRPLTAAALLVLMGALALSVGGSSPAAARGRGEESALRQQQIATLESFARAKEKQAQALAAKAREKITPEFQRFFAAAIKGDGRTVTNRFWYFREHHRQYEDKGKGSYRALDTAYWQPVLELCLAYNQFQDCDPKYTALFADGIIDSISAGSIYFGGTDPGRGVPTAFCKSHADADPFFTVTQNALADGTYLNYLRAMYGGKIYTPTAEDSQRCFQEYMTDAQRRLQQNKLKPGEDVKVVGSKVEVSGQVAVMAINGLLTKVMFDHNTNREFYVEESFPLDWMYPHLEPHGLIMKINRRPLAELPAEVMARDREYWRKIVGGMIGDWLGEQTTVREIADFVDRVYVHKDLKGFAGDTGFVQNDCAQKEFSKLRSSIGGLYMWRLNPDTNVCPAEYRPKSNAEHQRIRKEADFAFRQAFAICPYSPEAVFRYVQLLLQTVRADDALLVAEACVRLDPKNNAVRQLVETIKSYKKQRAGIKEAQAGFQQLEDEVRNNPTNVQAALDLASAYGQTGETKRRITVLEALSERPDLQANILQQLAEQYVQMGNMPKLESTLERLVKVTPSKAEPWYDLAAVKASLKKSSEALAALKQALELSATRLQADPKARDLRADARKDARFDTLRQTPEFQRLVPE
jgi:beta-lactamase regulating signal transducer with metallopeptidase domain/tetratricopeptide (TPR) repeat protein